MVLRLLILCWSLTWGNLAHAQTYSGIIDADRVSSAKAVFKSALSERGYSLDPASVDLDTMYFCIFGPIQGRNGIRGDEKDGFQFLFPEITEAAQDDLWDILEFIAALDVGLKAGGGDKNKIDELLSEVHIDVQFDAAHMFVGNPENSGQDAVMQIIVETFQKPEEQEFERSISCMITREYSIVPLVLEPSGARVFWTTPFREKVCSIAERPDDCAWTEVTGSPNVVLEGTRIFMAKWPDGKHTRATFSSLDETTQVFLRG